MILIVAASWTLIDSLFYIFRLTEEPAPTKYSLFQKHTTETILLRELNVFFLSMLMAYFLVFFMKNFFRRSSLWINMLLKALMIGLYAAARADCRKPGMIEAFRKFLRRAVSR